MASSSAIAGYTRPHTPRQDTECERCLRRINSQQDPAAIPGLLSSLFMKQVLPPADISDSNPETLKKLAFLAVQEIISPSTTREKQAYELNIRNIFANLILRGKLTQEDQTFFTQTLRCNYDEKDLYDPIPTSSTPTKPNSFASSVPRIQVNVDDAPELLRRHPIQWLFRVLYPTPDVTNIYKWETCIHPNVLVLGYKSCMTTDDFFENILIALTDPTLSKREKKKLYFSITNLLITWLSQRYHNHELSIEPTLEKFHKILSVLVKVPKTLEGKDSREKLRTELGILHSLFENLKVLTPRPESNPINLKPVEGIFKRLLETGNKNTFLAQCQLLVDEITACFMSYVTEIPLEEYFGNITSMEKSPNLSKLIKSLNALDPWLVYTCTKTFKGNDSRMIKMLVSAMKIAQDQRKYQTAFSLKTVLDVLVQIEPTRKIPVRYQDDFESIQSFFEIWNNRKKVRDQYALNDFELEKYLPIIGWVTGDLAFIYENPGTIEIKGIEVFNITRLNLIFKALNPVLNLVRNPELHKPNTDLKLKVESESALAESFVLAALKQRASKSRSRLHEGPPEC